MPGEIVALRGRASKQFDLGNGLIRAEFYGAPVHYAPAPGTPANAVGDVWRDVNTTFVNDAVTECDVQVRLVNTGIEITGRESGRGIRWRVGGKPVASGNTATITFAGVQWAFVVTSTQVKLRAVVAARLGVRTFQIPYDLLGGAGPLVINADGALVSGDDFVIPPVVALDPDGNEHVAGRYQLVTLPGNRPGIQFTWDDSQIALPYTLDPTTNFAITTGADDGQWTSSVFSSTSTSMPLGNNGSSVKLFTRFQNITIPQGALISSATLTLTVAIATSTTTVNVTLQANASDNAVAPTSIATGNALATTTATVAWNAIPAWGSTGVAQVAPDIATVVQEVISRAGWVSGNALMLLIYDNASGSASRLAAAFDHATFQEPQLSITYTPVVSGLKLVVGDVLGLKATQVRLGQSKRPVGSVLTLTETRVRLGQSKRVVSSLVTLPETTRRIIGRRLVVTSTLTLPEAAVRVLGLRRVVGDAITLASTQTRRLGLARVVNSTVTLPSSQGRARGIARVVNSTVTLSALQVRSRGIVKVVASTLTLRETLWTATARVVLDELVTLATSVTIQARTRTQTILARMSAFSERITSRHTSGGEEPDA